ncbi:MAG: QueT transporter family protein [Lachnospiraceae bacterium]|nr:QueT transporter family protein [Lachnospiraceae bacterium]
MNKKIYPMCQAAMIAALYVVLTFVSNAFGMASGPVQVRLSEAFTVLPYFTPAAIPGLAIGCLLSNWLTGCLAPDILFGTIATLIGALGSYSLRRYPWLVPLPPVLANTLIVPWVLRFAYGAEDAIPFMMLTVGAGEIISCYVLGLIFLYALKKYGASLFETH